jgi:hypothetical protein
MVNAMDTIINLLSDNWDADNTNSITPDIIKVTDQKRYDFNSGKDLIVIQRANELPQPAGIGVIGKHQTFSLDIDLRVLGEGKESHFFDVLNEIKRILDANIKIPSEDFHILNPDFNGLDLSDKTHKLYRWVQPVQLIKYNTQRVVA